MKRPGTPVGDPMKGASGVLAKLGDFDGTGFGGHPRPVGVGVHSSDAERHVQAGCGVGDVARLSWFVQAAAIARRFIVLPGPVCAASVQFHRSRTRRALPTPLARPTYSTASNSLSTSSALAASEANVQRSGTQTTRPPVDQSCGMVRSRPMGRNALGQPRFVLGSPGIAREVGAQFPDWSLRSLPGMATAKRSMSVLNIALNRRQDQRRAALRPTRPPDVGPSVLREERGPGRVPTHSFLAAGRCRPSGCANSSRQLCRSSHRRWTTARSEPSGVLRCRRPARLSSQGSTNIGRSAWT